MPQWILLCYFHSGTTLNHWCPSSRCVPWSQSWQRPAKPQLVLIPQADKPIHLHRRTSSAVSTRPLSRRIEIDLLKHSPLPPQSWHSDVYPKHHFYFFYLSNFCRGYHRFSMSTDSPNQTNTNASTLILNTCFVSVTKNRPYQCKGSKVWL